MRRELKLKKGRSWNKLAYIVRMSRRESVKREFTVVIERDEDGYFIGTVPQLKGCHTQAMSLDELMSRMKEAVMLCLEAEGKVEDDELQFVGVQRIAV